MACGVLLVTYDAFWGARMARFRMFEAACYAPAGGRIRTYVSAMPRAPAISAGFTAVAKGGASALRSVVCKPERYLGAVEKDLDTSGGSQSTRGEDRNVRVMLLQCG